MSKRRILFHTRLGPPNEHDRTITVSPTIADLAGSDHDCQDLDDRPPERNTSAATPHPSQSHAVSRVGLRSTVALLAGGSFWVFGTMNGLWHRPMDLWLGIYTLKTLMEMIAAAFALFYVLVALHYRNPRGRAMLRSSPAYEAKIAAVYLCCDDLDEQALTSIAAHGCDERTVLIVHDDSRLPEMRQKVEQVVERLRTTYRRQIEVLRRDVLDGKPGALNNVMRHLPEETQFLMIFDSDSIVAPGANIRDAMRLFDDPQVAVVQMRIVGHVLPDEPRHYQTLSSSVTFYDVFVAFMDRYGWSPFLGHNAIIRLSAAREVRGFTLGELADDIDFSVKLRLAGYRVRYARDTTCGERHPETYAALRRRTRKWAYGCTQVLLNWSVPILRSNIIHLHEKLCFFLTVSYYHFQLMLLAYLGLFYLVLPMDRSMTRFPPGLFLSAALILLFTFVPSLTFFVRAGRLRQWPTAAVVWGLTYGSQDLVILSGVWRCLARKRLPWIPTNAGVNTMRARALLPELLTGVVISAGAVWHGVGVVFLPTTMLFAGKFLVSPFLDRQVFHRNSALLPPRALPRRR